MEYSNIMEKDRYGNQIVVVWEELEGKYWQDYLAGEIEYTLVTDDYPSQMVRFLTKKEAQLTTFLELVYCIDNWTSQVWSKISDLVEMIFQDGLNKDNKQKRIKLSKRDETLITDGDFNYRNIINSGIN